MNRFAGKVALVSGGARGLGASIVRQLIGEGARVVLGDVRDEEGRTLATSLGAACMYVHLDVTKEAQWIKAIADTNERFGDIGVLVNNAGVFRTALMTEMSMDAYLQVVRINQLGCFLGMQASIKSLRRSQGGAIVNIASTAGIEGVRQAIAYTATKHAVIGMTKVAALELSEYGIRVNAVSPGAMATPLIAEHSSVPLSVIAKQELPGLPLKYMADPETVARSVLFLASEEAAYITGSELRVDGGLTAGR
jgi:3alpha(or 20beta)-hydroxysteroid dehydrogenase